MFGGIAKFVAEVLDMDLQSVTRALAVLAPEQMGQLGMRHYALGVVHQATQNLKLGESESHFRPFNPHFVGIEIDEQLSGHKGLAVSDQWQFLRPPKQGNYSGQQLQRADGSAEAIIRSSAQGSDNFILAFGGRNGYQRDRGKIPDLIQCALMHEQFEAIHPFLDGNGRVGRLLITLFLIERGRLSQPLLYLSAYIEEHRREYYDLLQRVRTHGDWSNWLHYFLAGVVEISRDAVSRASKLMDLREQFRKRLAGKAKALALLDALFVNPYMTVVKASEILATSNPTARQAVMTLEENGILEEVSGRRWGRLYLARPMMEVIEKAE